MEESKQHVQLPNEMEKSNLEPKDQLIYLAIKSYMNKDTLEAFPSLESISKRCGGASAPTIRKSVKNLVAAGYITTTPKGRGVVYKFNTTKSFEPFSYEFLENDNISFTTKAYIAASQEHMFKDHNGYGKMQYSSEEIANIINMPMRSVQRCDKELENNGLMVRSLDGVKIYDMQKMYQGIIWVLKNHEDRISENTNDIKDLKKAFEDYKRETSEQLEKERKEKNELKKTLDNFIKAQQIDNIKTYEANTIIM
jgi:predicted transcriptional regulator